MAVALFIHAVFFAVLVCLTLTIIYLILFYPREGFANRAEKKSELYNWFNNGGAGKSYKKFRDTFRGKKADIVDYENGRIAKNAGQLSPDIFG